VEVVKLAAALETRTIGVGLGCHGGVTGSDFVCVCRKEDLRVPVTAAVRGGNGRGVEVWREGERARSGQARERERGMCRYFTVGMDSERMGFC